MISSGERDKQTFRRVQDMHTTATISCAAQDFLIDIYIHFNADALHLCRQAIKTNPTSSSKICSPGLHDTGCIKLSNRIQNPRPDCGFLSLRFTFANVESRHLSTHPPGSLRWAAGSGWDPDKVGDAKQTPIFLSQIREEDSGNPWKAIEAHSGEINLRRWCNILGPPN
jgi:hypothetical protein